MSRTAAQAYTHKVTLLSDFMDEKKGQVFVLFDDGTVIDREIMTFRKPSPEVALVVRMFKDFPTFVTAVPNPNYHQHDYKEKKIRVCECGDEENE